MATEFEKQTALDTFVANVIINNYFPLLRSETVDRERIYRALDWAYAHMSIDDID